MRFSVVAAALLSTGVANAADHLIKVGANNGLVFDPTDITAVAGDTISFQFQGKNHSVTQSTFASPCVRQTTPTVGVDSGFMAVPSGAAQLPQWSITVNNATTPLWFFCAQTNPASHCQAGMVFSVNAPATKTFAQFQAAAKAGGGQANSTTSTAGSTGAGAPGYGSAGAGGPSNNSSAPATTSGGAAPATSPSPKSGAMKLGGSAAGALTAAALFISFVL